MTSMLRPLARLALVASLLLGGSSAQAQRPGEPRDGAHDMDFSIGSWRTDVTIFKEPFSPASPTVHLKGTKVARPLWNGKAVIEELEADGPEGHWEATNVFLYDPTAHQWSENYADSATGRFDGTPGIGGMRDGRIEFYSQQRIADQAMLVRGIWKDFTANAHTYEVSRSNDGGKTWHTSFVAHVTRER
ncbi:MAG: hypothetical protein ACRYG8_02685 [Janthinobacterium lividum]